MANEEYLNPQLVKARAVDDYTHTDDMYEDFFGEDYRVTDLVTGEDFGDFYRWLEEGSSGGRPGTYSSDMYYEAMPGGDVFEHDDYRIRTPEGIRGLGMGNIPDRYIEQREGGDITKAHRNIGGDLFKSNRQVYLDEEGNPMTKWGFNFFGIPIGGRERAISQERFDKVTDKMSGRAQGLLDFIDDKHKGRTDV